MDRFPLEMPSIKYLGILSALLFATTILYKGVLFMGARRKRYVKVGTVSKLFIYPIKGCQGVVVDEIEVTKYGLAAYKNVKDRMFSFVDDSGMLVNAMRVAKVDSISVQVMGACLIARCGQDGESIEIPIKQRLDEHDVVIEGEFKKRTIKGVLCDPNINRQFSDYLGLSVRLIQHLAELNFRPANTVDKCDAAFEKQFNIMFQNYVDFHLISLQSLDQLNEKIAQNSGPASRVSGVNFRPNMFVVDTRRPFDEDHWRYIRINDVKFIQIENCFRCNNTTIEDAKRKEPLYTLRKFRRSKIASEDKRVGSSPFFGCLLGTLAEGKVRVNDQIEAICVTVI